MSKSLEWLDYYKQIVIESNKTFRPNGFDLIEKELIEKEQQDSVLKILKEVIEFTQMLPHIEPNKDNVFDVMSAVGINIQRDIENRERELLRQWVLDTCFPKELKALEIIKEIIELYPTTSNVLMMCVSQEKQNLLREVLL